MAIEKTERTFYIHKSRNLVALFKDAYQYMSDDARLLLRTMFLFSFTLIITSLIIAYIVANGSPSVERIFTLKDAVSKPAFIIYIFCCFAFIGGFCTLTLVVNKLLLLKDEHKNETSQIPFKIVVSNISTSLKNYFFNFLIIYFIYYGGSFAINYLSRVYIFTDLGEMDPDPINAVIDWLIRNLPLIIIFPLFMYFGFASLFMSVRDDIGSSDALKKIFELSKNKIKKIWFYSLVVLIIAYLGDELLRSFARSISIALSSQLIVFFIIISVQKLISIGFFVFMQVFSVLLLGSVEDDLEGHYIKNKIDEI